MSIKISSIIALFASMVIAAPAIWNGTADVSWFKSNAQSFNLATAEQLAGLAQLVNQGISSFDGKTITLEADIFLNDTTGAGAGTWASVPHTEWTPIGTKSRPFMGEFDGIAGKKNRKIYGLYINNTTEDYAGLFGYTSNVKISNLDVLVGRITANDNAGALIGFALGGSVTNVHSEIRVTGNNHVGGLVGYFTGDLSVSSVKENVVGRDSVGGLIGITTGSVSGTDKSNSYFVGNVTGRQYVGGLIGIGANISKSYADGSVKGDSSYVGGVAGYASGTIDSVRHVGDVNGSSYVAGLAGYVKGKIINSFSEGNIAAKGFYIGGVVGYAVGTIDSIYHVDGNVTGFGYVGGVAGFADGTINSAYHVGGDVSGSWHYVGGLVGYGTTVSKSYAEGMVKGDSNYVGGVAGYARKNINSSYHRGGNVSGFSYIGGLVGKIDSTVTNSYSEGDVLAKGNNVGGLIGLSYYFYTGSVAKTVNVSLKSFAIGQVKGNNYVGGLVGLDSAYRSGSSTLSRHIVSSYSKGDVEGNMYVGGVVGRFNSTSNTNTLEVIDSSYHSDGNVFGKSNYVGGVAGATRGVISSSKHLVGDVSGYSYVGGLVGQIDSTVIDSYSKGNVTGTGNYVGGLIGYLFYTYRGSDHVNMITLNESYSIGNVEGENFVGGLIGMDSTYRGVSNTRNVSRNLKNSSFQGNVKGSMYVGGVVGKSNYGGYSSTYDGYVHNYIDSCFHDGGDVSGRGYVAGLVGYTTGSVANSYSKGNVVGSYSYVGGLVGYGSVISNSYVEGAVKGDANYVGGVAGCATATVYSVNHKGGDVLGHDNVGGLIGLALRSVNATDSKDSTYIMNSYSVGNVEGNNSVGGAIGNDSLHRVLTKGKSNWSHSSIIRHVSGLSSSGNIKGKNFVGGLIGKQSVGSDSSNKYASWMDFDIILSSHNEGRVSADSNYVGGIVGFSKGPVDSVYHDGGDVCGFSYVGGLIGYSEGSVKNAHSDANVEGGGLYVGGLVGLGFSISKSYAKGNVSSDSSYVGGVAGKASSIDSTYHIDGDVHGYGYVGGLVGQATSSVTNSYSEGNVIGALDYVGGTAGSVLGKVRNSYAKTKNVRGRNLVGGLAGYVNDSIDVSYFEGDSVTGIYQIGGLVGRAINAVDSSYSTANVKGDDNVGGLIGSAYGDVSYSYALGNVVGDVEHSSAGNDNLGGLVGYQYNGSVSKSMALGDVLGTTKLGGLVGRFDGTKISQSYANGNVTGRYYGDPADEVGNYYIGGFVGYAKGSLEEVYASGVVNGIENEPVYTGCIVGYVNGSLSVTKSYYDKTKCGLGVDGGEGSALVFGTPSKTTAEMQNQETFENWDFAETWKIQKGSYPFLQIYSNSLTNAVVTTASLEGIKYDGKEKFPVVTSVTLFGETLEYETDYTVIYKDNVNAGTATINVCGVKPYGGCKMVEFEIEGFAIKPTIAAIDKLTYTGRALTPEIKVYNGGSLLAATDYAVEYKNNVNAGTATVSITMKGNYSGSASKTFTIEKAAPLVSQNPKASDVLLGQTLASSELSGGRANVDGEFVWKTSTTKPALKNEGYAVVFVPTDTKNYTNSAEIVVPVKVLDLVYVAIHLGETTLDSVTLERGSYYTLPKVPDSTGYDFVGFYKGSTIAGKPGDKISVTGNTVIDAKYNVQTFVITFMNGTVVLQSSEIAYGVVPTAPKVSLPKNTAQYTYSFGGWNKDVVAVTEAATYTAIIDCVVNKYNVVFKNYDGSVLSDSSYEYGTAAIDIAQPTDPTKTPTVEIAYIFKGWNPDISEVTGNVVYTAVYESSVRRYEISFVNASTVLQSDMVEYGMKPVYEGSTPVKAKTAQYTYSFKGWNPEVADVTENVTYKAVFDSVVNKYDVVFKNYDGTVLRDSTYAYGTVASGVIKPADPRKPATAKYTYTFKSWAPAIAKVTGNAIYTAVFDSVVNKYLVTFKQGATVLLKDSLVYGSMPTAPLVTLPKNTMKYTYTFMGWNPHIVSVTGTVTYNVVIDSSLNKYSIVFKNYDGTVIRESMFEFGTAVSVIKPADPERTSTAKFTYSFKDWTPIVIDVKKAATYTAVFDSTVRTYTITFMNGNTKLQTIDVEYGKIPKYTGKTPTKSSNNKYSYTFAGWSPKIASVTKAATYQAVFDSTKQTGLIETRFVSSGLSVRALARSIQISAAPVGSIYAITDLQGRVLKKGFVESPDFNIAMPQAGIYLVRIGEELRKVSIR